MTMITTTLFFISPVILAYLLGSIPTSVWVGKRFYHLDIRNEGSGNAGATNMIRVLGLKAGIPVMIVDVCKGYLAIYVAPMVASLFSEVPVSPYIILAAAAAAVLGHTFPIFAGFRGGKGVATMLGVAIGLFPAAAGVTVFIFALIFILTRYVSLSSITAAICFPILVIFVFHSPCIAYSILAIAVAVFIPITHRKNIERLIHGTESKITFKKAI